MNNTIGLNENQKELRKFTDKLSHNLFDTIASLSILKTIEDVAVKINQDGHGAYYSYIQRQMINSSILSINKMFDTDKKSITVDKINKYIAYNYRSIPMKEPVTKMGAEDFKYFDKDKLVSISNTDSLAKYLSLEVEKIKILYKTDLEALRDLRDRYIAHTDTRLIENITSWNKVDELVIFLLDYLDLIDFVLLSSFWSGDGEKPCSMLISDAEKPSISLKRTFEKLGYIDL